ncbi:hypothetical protein MMC30_008974 [Trapelia coarctata]|nr:hypothetical protein [Trapelia coarctata]
MAASKLFDLVHLPSSGIWFIPLYLILFTAAIYGVVALITWFPLRHFPGPRLASFSELWLAKTIYHGNMGETFVKINKKYGHLARVGPRDLMTDDADTIRYISDPKKSGFVRSDWYASANLDPENHHIFSTQDMDYHDKLKTQMTPGYGRRENPMLEQSVDDIIQGMFRHIERSYLSSAADTKRLDLGKLINYFTLDVITKVSFGDAFGFLAKDEDVHQYLATLNPTVPITTIISACPTLRWIFGIRWVASLISPTNDRTKGFGKLAAICEDVVSKRLNDEEQQDMLGSFLRHGLNAKELEGAVQIQLVAGSDTTATGLRATLLYLITNPRVLRRLRLEIDEAIASGRVSRPVIQSHESKQLPYLQACIREGLRIHAPTAPLLSKVAGPGGATLHGKFVPPGTRIAHNQWGFLRNAEVFGEDVDMYRPERWLSEGMPGMGGEKWEERKMRMLRDVDLLFGFGKWGCLGKSLAEIELNKVFFELLNRFDFAVINPAKAWSSEEYNIFRIRDYWVRVTAREL